MGIENWLISWVYGAFGLVIGSFLNVVIYRLPKMMERSWEAECAEFTGKVTQPKDPFNLVVPRSRCSHCGHPIHWYENIPILSYLALRGKCSSCSHGIGIRYPIVEGVCGLLFFACAWRWGLTPQSVLWCVFCAVLLTLALIDWDTTLLPDDLTLPLLWLGLISAALRWIPVDLMSSLWGVVAGYLSLWSIYWAFKLVTGKEGMGYGDFKLFAALGAWFGWQTLVPIILLAAVVGTVLGIGMKLFGGLREGGYMPFGPFLAGGGFAALYFDPNVLRVALSP